LGLFCSGAGLPGFLYYNRLKKFCCIADLEDGGIVPLNLLSVALRIHGITCWRQDYAGKS